MQMKSADNSHSQPQIKKDFLVFLFFFEENYRYPESVVQIKEKKEENFVEQTRWLGKKKKRKKPDFFFKKYVTILYT